MKAELFDKLQADRILRQLQIFDPAFFPAASCPDREKKAGEKIDVEGQLKSHASISLTEWQYTAQLSLLIHFES